MAQEIIIGSDVTFFYGLKHGAQTVKEGTIVGTNGKRIKIELGAKDDYEVVDVHRDQIIFEN